MSGKSFHFVWSTWAAVGGLLGGLGVALLLQQFAVFALTLGLLLGGAAIGLAFGALLPTLLYLILPSGGVPS